MHLPVSGTCPTGAPIVQSAAGYCFGSIDIALNPNLPVSMATANIPVCIRCIKNFAVGEFLTSRDPTSSDLIKYKSPPACGALGILTRIAPLPVGKFCDGSPWKSYFPLSAKMPAGCTSRSLPSSVFAKILVMQSTVFIASHFGRTAR